MGLLRLLRLLTETATDEYNNTVQDTEDIEADQSATRSTETAETNTDVPSEATVYVSETANKNNQIREAGETATETAGTL